MANQDLLSDHCIIKFKTALCRPPAGKINITYRNLDGIDLDKFKRDLTAKLWTIRNSGNLQKLYDGYMQAIESTLQIHAPEVNKITKEKGNKSLVWQWRSPTKIQKKSSRDKMAQIQNLDKQRKIPENQ